MPPRFRFLPAILLLSGLWLAAGSGCALFRGENAYDEPCTLMQHQLREKQKLDAAVNTLARRAERYREEGDTASAASAARRLSGMRENQRLLKESLERSSRDCHPQWQDPVPVRDPARREHIENPPR